MPSFLRRVRNAFADMPFKNQRAYFFKCVLINKLRIYTFSLWRVSVYISRSADNSLCALSSTPDSKSCACEHMVSHLKSGMRSGYLDCRSDP
jgi:hypothetical protein